MKDKNVDVNLAGMSDAFNNKTFRYRINGFAHACKMHNIGVVANAGVLFNSTGFDKYGNRETSNDHSYLIAVTEKDGNSGKSVTLSGEHDDLLFVFTNYYNKENLDKKIYDLPFSITLEKKIDDYTYKIVIETVEKERTKFMLTKYAEYKRNSIHQDLVFYSNVMDFSHILKIISGFVYNPSLAFNTYNEVMKQQKIVFASSIVDKVAMDDANLDKPVGKIKKIINNIIK